MKKLTVDDIIRFVGYAGGELLSKEYKNNKQKISVRCLRCDNIWTPRFNDLQQGHWCPKCNKSEKHSYEFVKKHIADLGGRLLSGYKDVDTKIKILCLKCNFQWEPTFYSVKNLKSWCPSCNGGVRHTLSSVKEYLKEHNYLLLSDDYKNNQDPLKIECLICGNDRDVALQSIKKHPTCPKCKNINKFKEIKKYVESREGELLSTTYKSSNSRATVRCLRCDNIWRPKFNYLRQGNWCPKCNASKNQKLIEETIRKYFPDFDIMIDSYPFCDLINPKTKRKLQVDIWCKNKKLAIEYDGEQHFMPVCFGGISYGDAKRKFERQIICDKLKNNYMTKSDNVKYFVRFNYQQDLNEKFIVDSIKKAIGE